MITQTQAMFFALMIVGVVALVLLALVVRTLEEIRKMRARYSFSHSADTGRSERLGPSAASLRA
jgi:hypothetical protein